jgi:hypothetical protein
VEDMAVVCAGDRIGICMVHVARGESMRRFFAVRVDIEHITYNYVLCGTTKTVKKRAMELVMKRKLRKKDMDVKLKEVDAI